MPQPPTDGPNVAILFLLGIAAAGLLIFLLWLNHTIATRGQPKSEAPASPTIEARPIGSSPPHARPSIAYLIMSRFWGMAGPMEADTSGLADDAAEALQPIATPCKGANDGLTGQGLDDRGANGLDDITPAEVRAIIRQQARAEAIVAILRAAEAGKVKSASDQAGLIEAVSGASRTSRPASPYSHLKVVVDELRGKPKPAYQPLDERHRAIGVAPAQTEA